MGLWYPKDSGFELIAYSDADHAGCKVDCKSTSGGLQFLGGKLVSWSLKKQDCTAMSTVEAEYVSLSACCAQVIWMQHVEKGTVEIYFVGTEYQLVDLFTKALPKECFEYLVHRIVIIMAQQQHAADVHPDELCPSNKRCDLMDANKKVNLEHVQYKSFIFHKQLPTIHNSFVPPPSFSDMVPFYKQVLGFTMELKTQSSFKTTGLLQPWQTFTKIIIGHYMTIFPDISRRARDMYHNLQDDDIMKNIFNSGRHKNKVGMQIPAWMITNEMKQIEHYQMYAEVFRIDVPLNQLQPTESTQGTHRTPSAPRSLNPDKEVAESIPTIDKADELILQDTLQVSLVEHKSHEEQENIVNDSSIPRNDESNIPDTRIDPRSDKERPEVDIAKEKEVEISKETEVELTNVVIPVNVNDEDKEITDEVYELKRREKGKNVKETRYLPIPTPIRSPRIHTNLVSSDTKKLQELTDTPHTTSSSSSSHKNVS
ncbi:hypothetical protein Tco_1427873 [Tanacetum coccineum]